MAMRIVMFLYVVTLCMGLTSCQKLGPDMEALQAAQELLKKETPKSLDAIPVEYGNLVGVTTNSQNPEWSQVWFEKPDKTLVVVMVNTLTGYIWKEALLIPRR
jgi:hypothetical protein